MMPFQIRQASNADIPTITHLAQQTWFVSYASILSEAQAQFMFEMMYSPTALQAQMEEKKHTFLIIEQENEPQGFASFGLINTAVCKLHKLYVLPHTQGQGLGKLLIEKVSQMSQVLGATHLQLNVNRRNSALHFYQKLDFKILKEEDIAIGQGFFMNDYVMQKCL